MGNRAGLCTKPGHVEDATIVDTSKLCVRARARDLPRVNEGVSVPWSVLDVGRDGRECYLLLERCLDVPRNLAGAAVCGGGGGGSPSNSPLSCAVSAEAGHPYVKAWAERPNGERLAEPVEWPVRRNAVAPSWFSAKSLGFSIAKAPDAKLVVEVRDQSGLLGTMEKPLGKIPANQLQKEEFEQPEFRSDESPRKSYCTFQVLSGSAVQQRRVVYFVRHAESQWNQAQSKLDLQELTKTDDHSLSMKGCKQCVTVRKTVQEALRRGDKHAKNILNADAFYVSPLTRAIQTAVIAFGPLLVANQPRPAAGRPQQRGQLMLMGSAREKQNFGGFDSMSDKKGREILNHTYHELLGLLLEDDESRDEVTNAFRTLQWDVQDAEEEWWCSKASDTAEELDLRLKDFMSQLLYTPHENSVVVGHSHFFRSVFKGFLSEEFREKEVNFTKQLTKEKMDNGGIIRVELDPSRSLLDGPIVNVELVLGSRLIADGGGMMACCKPPVSQDDELQVDPPTFPPPA